MCIMQGSSRDGFMLKIIDAAGRKEEQLIYIERLAKGSENDGRHGDGTC